MNEEQKHIESCRAEDVLSQSMEQAATEDIAQAALQPLLVETMPGYVPVATTAPTSPIAELPGVLISIIRRVATKPLTMFGERPDKQSLLGSLLDTWNAIRQRLSGNPSAGIPDRRADMTAHSLPTSLALLSDRKISNGFSTTDGIPDGMSLARLLCATSATNSVTEINDDNVGWGITLSNLQSILALFSKIKRLTLKAKGGITLYSIQNHQELEYISIPYITSANVYVANASTNPALQPACIRNNPKVKEIYAPSISIVTFNGNGDEYNSLIGNCSALEEVTLGHVTNNGWPGLGTYKNIIRSCENLKKLHVAGVAENNYLMNSAQNANLILLEFTAEQTNSANLAWWSPTNALDASRTDLIEQGSEAENNLQQFLLNFREFIALRLANRKDTTALTLTLSAAVYNAVTGADSGWASLHTLAELGITTDDLTELEQELGITTATLYSTWLDTYTGANGIHWNINKAN